MRDGRPIKEVWFEYKKTGREDLHHVLMDHYLSVVQDNAKCIHSKLDVEVDVEDLISAGVFALMDAIDAFDLHSDVTFETFCAPRISAAILNELRTQD